MAFHEYFSCEMVFVTDVVKFLGADVKPAGLLLFHDLDRAGEHDLDAGIRIDLLLRQLEVEHGVPAGNEGHAVPGDFGQATPDLEIDLADMRPDEGIELSPAAVFL